MIERVLGTIKKYRLLKNGDNIVVGVSGGPDSVCLLHVLCSIRKDYDLKLFAVHINHMLRGRESHRDEEFVKNLCNQLKVDLKSVCIDIKRISKERGMSLEETGREERYRHFEIAADYLEADRIAVAHNKNDQAETVLMNIIRGSGIGGLKGMDYERGRIIRPILDIERKEIEIYCTENSLNPIIDSSNLESIYSRNKIRLNVIPYIDKLFNSDLVNTIDRMSRLIKDDSDFIDEQISSFYNMSLIKKEGEELELSLDKIKKVHIAAKRRVIRRAINEIKGNVKGIESVHIESVIDLIDNGRVSARLDLPTGIKVRRSYESIKFYRNEKQADIFDFNLVLNIPGVTVIGETGDSIEAEVIGSYSSSEYKGVKNCSMTQFFDYDRMSKGINVRKRIEGDQFKPLNSRGTKKLKEYFIDCKIPKDMRDNIPLITKGSEIIWIVGYKISDKFKVTENTKRVLKIIYKSNLF